MRGDQQRRRDKHKRNQPTGKEALIAMMVAIGAAITMSQVAMMHYTTASYFAVFVFVITLSIEVYVVRKFLKLSKLKQ